MRSLSCPLLVALAASVLALPAGADMTFTVTKDSTMDGNAGQLLEVTEPGYPTETFFLFVEDGLVRAYATRDNSTGAWQTPLIPIYLVPSTSITAGQTWAFLPTGSAFLTQAEAIKEESVTVGAGTFDCWRVEITAVGSPDDVLAVFWFANGVGFVKQDEFESGASAWKVELESYSVSGGGYFPLDVGNTWTFLGLEVPNRASSMGDLKSRFAH